MERCMHSELGSAMQICTAKFPTCVQQINYPVHNGKPNPTHGKFIFVGSIPGACYDRDKHSSLKYDTEQEAIDAAIAAGATRIQRTDCSFVKGYE